jgi:hypothetical protein
VPKVQSKTLADFRSTFDPDVKVPAKIKEALASLLAEGPEAWEYEADFIKRVGTSTTLFAKYRDQFAKHFVTVRIEKSGSAKNIWFGDFKVADKVR